ncbi:MAG: hypothetical protein Pg6A_13080 [Termitinemataceae bacterium]|nr:MAG: hypothetical protein Pg6A_13080 [Termitinemataceae bacterium]
MRLRFRRFLSIAAPIGEKGAAALDAAEESNRRAASLDAAREMESAGKDARAVRLATGWELGADGLWRYEIADGKLITARYTKEHEAATGSL